MRGRGAAMLSGVCASGVWLVGSVAGYAALLEGASVLLAGGGASLVLACASAAVVLTFWLSFLIAVPVALAFWLAEQSKRRFLVDWPVTIGCAVVGGAVAWWLADPMVRLAWPAYIGFVVVVAGVCALCHWLTRAEPPHLARGAALLIAAAGMGGDLYLKAGTYTELHDLAYLVAIVGVLAATSWMRPRLVRARWVVPAMLALPLLSWAAWIGIAAAEPTWRWFSYGNGRSAPSAARALRSLVDFDGDRFSPVLGGGDCDDFDSDIHPHAYDPPGGGDQNCNGVDPPAEPTVQQRGLTPEFGEPAADANEFPLVLFISIDTWRWDTLTPEMMPALSRFAKERCLRFRRMYSAGSQTYHSLPLILAHDMEGPWLGDELAAAGVATTSLLGSAIRTDYWGFSPVVYRDADDITDDGLKRAREVKGRHFLWVHYFEPHALGPFQEVTTGPGPAHIKAPYRAALRHADAAIGRLLATLDAEGRLDRALIVVTSDHGEGLGDHGIDSHSRGGYDSILRVPGLICGAGFPAGESDLLVSHRDLAPTFLGAFGLGDKARKAELFGRSWLRLRGQPDRPLHEFVYARSARYSSGRRQEVPTAILVDERYKLIYGVEDKDTELYDLVSDPAEAVNLAGDSEAVVEELWNKLATAVDIDGFPSDIPEY